MGHVVESAQADEVHPELVAVHFVELGLVQEQGGKALSNMARRQVGVLAKDDPRGAVNFRVLPEVARLELNDVLFGELLLEGDRLKVAPCDCLKKFLAGARYSAIFLKELA